jgi:DNA-binding beta-propeller fold protein YncE
MTVRPAGFLWPAATMVCLAMPVAGVPPLEPLPGTTACVSENPSGSCVDGKSLSGSIAVAVSPNGLSVYVAAPGADAVAVFARSLSTGQLTQLSGTEGCVSDSGSGGDCVNGRALSDVFDVVVSPDGANVYTAATIGGIAIFDRDRVTGELTQKAGTAGCINGSGSDSCTAGTQIGNAWSLAVSPDGRNLYSVSSLGIAVFDRDLASGALTQKAGAAACISETQIGCTVAVALLGAGGVALSPDGRDVYVAAGTSDAVAAFDRDLATGVLTQKAGIAACVSETGTGGACRDGVALDGASDVAVSGDGLTLYVAAQTSDAVVVLGRSRATGELTLKLGSANCVSETGTGGACADGVALDGVRSVAVSPDLRSVYAAAGTTGAIAVFDRFAAPGVTGGVLTQKPGRAGCVSFDETGGACLAFFPTVTAWGLAVSPDARNVYVTSFGNSIVSVLTRFVLAYDIDGNGELDALTDGLLLLRYLFGFSGAALVTGAVDTLDCTRCEAPEIEPYLEALAAP